MTVWAIAVYINDSRDEIVTNVPGELQIDTATTPTRERFVTAIHNIQPEVPAANMRALFDAGKELGRYPLN